MNSQQTEYPTRRSSFFQAISFTGVGTFVNIIFLFLETMLIARVLDTGSYGIFALLIVIVNFLLMVIDFGTVTSVTQLIASSDQTRQTGLASSAILFRLFTVMVFSSIVLLGRNGLNGLDPSGLLVTYSVYIPMMLFFAGLDEILLAILQGKQHYKQMAIAQILRSVSRLGLTVFFFYGMKLGFLTPIYSWIISFGISVAYEYLVLPFSKRLSMNWRLLGSMLRFGFPLQLNNFLWFASTSSQPLLLSALIGPSAVAFFDVAMRIPNAIIRLSQAYTAVYFPTVTSLLAEGKWNQARRLLEHSLNLASFFMALVALISVVFNHQIVTLLFSEKYAASGPIFALLMLAVHMTVLVTLMGYTLVAIGFPARSLVANATREGLMFLVNLILIPTIGFIGPAYAKIFAFYMANPLSVWLLRKSNFIITVTPYLKQTMLLLVSAAAYWIFQPKSIIIKIAIIIIFIVLNILFSTLSRDDVSLILPEYIRKKFSLATGVFPRS